jgi:hypothetical protein
MMHSVSALVQHSNDIARENEAAEISTRYVVKLTKTGAYARRRFAWTYDAMQAAHFEFMTTALIYAFEILELAPEDFDVECVAVSA